MKESEWMVVEEDRFPDSDSSYAGDEGDGPSVEEEEEKEEGVT